MTTRDDLLRMSRRELLQVIRDGYSIQPEALDDTGYRGISLGLPPSLERLSWKTFQKTFHRDPKTGHLRGWNVRVEQRGVDAPTVAQKKNGVPWTWGHYQVIDGNVPMPHIEQNPGLLIHYGVAENGALTLLRRVRDPLVSLAPDNVDLLLGWSYVDLGLFSFGTPSFFSLEREGPLEYIP